MFAALVRHHFCTILSRTLKNMVEKLRGISSYCKRTIDYKGKNRGNKNTLSLLIPADPNILDVMNTQPFMNPENPI